MAIDIKFDLVGNPEPPTIILANRNGNKLGQLDVDVTSIELTEKFNDVSEFSFIMYKPTLTYENVSSDLDKATLKTGDGYWLQDFDELYLSSNDNTISYEDFKMALWEKTVDFKLVYCKEWDMWFEIRVELDEATETMKTVFCTQLGQAELSQIKLYNIHINEEGDPNWDTNNQTYKSTILYDEKNTDVSLLHRLLKDKAPHYSIKYVDNTIARIQRTFSFDDISIYDAFQEIAEEIGCLFVYHSNSGEGGKIQRTISVYDLQQNCNDCKHRGEFTDKCPKCGSENITNGYGDDTLIFVTSDELASKGIQLTTDTESVKNCFKLKAGDDLMTATVRNCNPNGTDYIWYLSDAVKEDMTDELVEKIKEYDESYRYYYDNYESILDATLVGQYNTLVEKYKNYYNTPSTCLNCGHKGDFYDECPECKNKNILTGRNLQPILPSIKGYAALMNAYYDVIDLALYLKSSFMPNVEMSETNAEEQADLLVDLFPSTIAVNVKEAKSISESTANSAALSMAKVIVKPTYKVEIEKSSLSEDKIWEGNFIITNYSDENDNAKSQTIRVDVNNDAETFIKQKIEKALNKEDTDDYSISALFKKDYDKFCDELQKYALNPLQSFYDACQTCLGILQEQGVGNDTTSDLYIKLYAPYNEKSSAIAEEISRREEEISIITGTYDVDSILTNEGLQTNIENCRNDIQAELDFETYLGEDLWLEFCLYRREDTYSNDNYISDGLNNAELFDKALEFFKVAENEIYKSAELQHSISTTLNNLLAIKKFKPLVNSFKVGNWIRVQIDDKIFKLRLLEYDVDFGDFDNIPVEFSDVTKIKNGITDVKDVMSQMSSIATSYNSVKKQADQGSIAQGTIEQWIADGLDAANTQIKNNNTEEVTISKNGLLGRSYDFITGTYSDEQVKLTHNILAYTDNNWETVKQAIGKHDYKFFDKGANDFVSKTGYGMTAEFVNAGHISGSQIIGGDIYSINYKNADEEGEKNRGSYLNLTDGTFSFAGGKLTYDGNDLSVDGKITIATSGTIGCWTVDNFSIHKNSDIFGSAEGMYFGINGLSLGDSFQVASNGIATMVGADITGTIHAQKGGTIGGFDIGENSIVTNKKPSFDDDASDGVYFGTDGIGLGQGKFWVDDSGRLHAIKGEIGGFEINESSIYHTKTAYNDIENDGIYIGTDGIGLGKGKFSVDSQGEMTSTKGTIAGWNIDEHRMHKNGVGIASFNKDEADEKFTHASLVEPTTTDDNGEEITNYVPVCFYAGRHGDDDSYMGNFTVLCDGSLYATAAHIEGNIIAKSGEFTGTITANQGNIGGFWIDTNNIHHTKEEYNDDKDGVYLGTEGIGLGAGKFYVTSAGAMTAKRGKIGGWEIKDDWFESDGSESGVYCGLYSGNYSTDQWYSCNKPSLVTPGTYSNGRFYAGAPVREGIGDSKFAVLDDGSLYASAAKLGNGNLGESDSIFLNTTDMAGVDGFFDGTSINNWRLTVGSHFGVTSDGSLYASAVNIIGGTLSMGGADDADDYVLINTSGRSVLSIWRNVDLDSIWNIGRAAYPCLDISGVGIYFGYASTFKGEIVHQPNRMIYQGNQVLLTGTWSEAVSTATASDASLKHNIELLDTRYDVFFDDIIARRFKYNDGSSDRYHFGYITQEIQTALQKSGISEKEFAAICTFSQGTNEEYSALRYDEFVPLNTWQIQKLKARTTELENYVKKLEERIAKLENK